MSKLPLGAAYSHAKATGKDQSQGAQRRRANAFLRRNGHPAMSAKVAKGILDRWRAMTTDERADQFNLQAAGISPEVARALAMQGNGKAPKRKPLFGNGVAKTAYASAYRKAARDALDPDVDAALHRKARASAGGQGARVANRGRASEGSTALLKRARRMQKRAAAMLARVDKGGPTLGETTANGHTSGFTNPKRGQKKWLLTKSVDAIIKSALAPVAKGGPGSGPKPGGGGFGKPTVHGADSHLAAAKRHIQRARQARAAGDHANADKHTAHAHERMKQALGASTQRLQKQAAPVTKRHMVAQLANEFVQAAYEPPKTPGLQGGFDDRPNCAQYLDAQRLVAGMDQETISADITPTMARARASGALATDMGAYDRVVAGPDRAIAGVGGLNLDLGSGQARQRGFLGVDIYPYDYGTVLHDLGMGIPFPDGSARAVRLNNTLSSLDDYKDNPTPLLEEVQRVLAIGGRFYYTGQPIQSSVDWSKLPGLGVVSRQFGDGGTVLGLTLARVPAKLPLVYGADVNFLSVNEREPADLALSQATFGAVPSADVAMANLVHKKEHVQMQARVLKKDDWQHVVVGAVLVPDEIDCQGDQISADEIRTTAHNFMANARVVGREHTEVFDGGEVVESYIAPVDMDFNDPSYGPQSIPKGTWVLGVRVPEADWPAILDGTFTGFSVGGWGEREDVGAA